MVNQKLKLFRVACAYAGVSQLEFARRCGFSWTYVWLVIIGRKNSKPITAAVRKFLKKHLPAEAYAIYQQIQEQEGRE